MASINEKRGISARTSAASRLARSRALGGTWESLKVNKARKLLAATAVPIAAGTGYFSVYDISDCAHPRLLNRGAGTDVTMPLPFISHEGGFSPDGNTYWVSGPAPGFLTAIDIRNPAEPRILWQGLHGLGGHGFGMRQQGLPVDSWSARLDDWLRFQGLLQPRSK